MSDDIDIAHKPERPLGHRAFGQIPHLPGSRRGPSDRGLNDGQTRIATKVAQDKYDLVVVQEKLDGSNVAIANIDGAIVPLTRAGYHARDSFYAQHRVFATWVARNEGAALAVLAPGERLAGEWLLQAHGTVYDLTGRSPFVALDIMHDGHERLPWFEFVQRVAPYFSIAPTLHVGCPQSIGDALDKLGDYGYYGAQDRAEGLVWRVERLGKVDFMTKYVRSDKVDGAYFDRDEPVWNVDKGAWPWTVIW